MLLSTLREGFRVQRGATAVLGFPQVEQVAWEPPHRSGSGGKPSPKFAWRETLLATSLCSAGLTAPPLLPPLLP
ncbi:hypothetical protein A6770_24655 [Nostoc minutum NIES-26]|uniref:Uncharacterized protein n=1 Tax=Nostoc minutum NIES-26 TaxID=1844469 RepID=A0A367QUY9_9NOSO|nr:hypothetical protein A6770_24655 [Nostoc minutum NIES-26]